ncbi:ROK family protein [Frondihabitans australicus]|uniref:Putative NBD/HSP70 family sugar kinase n=1 Tax=Frondihabitans australicus TaxID=386892 RepID=A0A495IHF6_9MICO|nr:ROK family protein [Frondihabitans australicus]RKR75433.1 putative NBD/HSP70 family sugar kinase [Frondihabitans australicus]
MRAGLDIGGTKIDAVAVDDDGIRTASLRLATGFGEAAVLASARDAVEGLRRLVGEGFETIGVGIPGLVDPATGRVRHAVNLGLDDTDFGRELETLVGAPVTVENDVNAAALGAYHLMGLEGPVAYLNLGTGLAAGIVLDGRLWRGSRGVSGEIGHIPADPAGYPCPCGQRGCLETVASGSAIARLWPATDEVRAGDHPAQALFREAAAGDTEAVRIRDDLATGVAAAIRILVLTVDVESVVIGGGLSHVGAPLLTEVQRVLRSWAASSTFLASLDLPDRIALLPEGLSVAAVGAAMLGRPESVLHS